MSLLNTARYRDRVIKVFAEANIQLDIISAFITAPGIADLLDVRKPHVYVRVLTRWRLSDLICGASDLTVYTELRQFGIKLYVNQDLHAKAVLSDRRTILLGSANLTGRGLKLNGQHGNIELGAQLAAGERDLAEIDEVFAFAVEMTDALFEDIAASVEAAAEKRESEVPEFSAAIQARLSASIRGLWVRDLFWSSYPWLRTSGTVDQNHDTELLGIKAENLDGSEVKKRLQSLSCVVWLIQELNGGGGELYFGNIASRLHEILLEDPKPYRKDVKMLTANLLAWCAHLLPDVFQIDTPNFSQRVSLKSATNEKATQSYWIDRVLNLKQDHDPTTWSEETLFASPHKPLFLLSFLMKQFDNDESATSFSLSPTLRAKFDKLWRAVSGLDRDGDPFLPFVHLSSDGLWNLSAGSRASLTAMEARGMRALDRGSVQADLDAGFVKLLANRDFRDQLIDLITRRYFGAGTATALKRQIELA